MPAWARQRMRERSARTSFRCIGRRRSLPRRRRRFECCSSFVHCELAGCDVQARLVSRSSGSFRPTRPAHRRPQHRRCHDGPPLRLPYASTSASPGFADLLLFLNGASLAARRRTQRAVGPKQQVDAVPAIATAGGISRGWERPCCADREKGSEAVSPVAICGRARLRSLRTRRPAAPGRAAPGDWPPTGPQDGLLWSATAATPACFRSRSLPTPGAATRTRVLGTRVRSALSLSGCLAGRGRGEPAWSDVP